MLFWKVGILKSVVWKSSICVSVSVYKTLVWFWTKKSLRFVSDAPRNNYEIELHGLEPSSTFKSLILVTFQLTVRKKKECIYMKSP